MMGIVLPMAAAPPTCPPYQLLSPVPCCSDPTPCAVEASESWSLLEGVRLRPHMQHLLSLLGLLSPVSALRIEEHMSRLLQST